MDSDEGIRIEDPNGIKKIFINRNLLGTYIILVRVKEFDNDREKIFCFNEIETVLQFIKKNLDEYNIWIY
ncbi:MAG: hypothetical protein ACTHKK_08475 [Candidatus Nitrosocosmicus sp.]